MNIYTVSFFGHREANIISEIEDRLDKLLHDIMVVSSFKLKDIRNEFHCFSFKFLSYPTIPEFCTLYIRNVQKTIRAKGDPKWKKQLRTS